MTAYPYREFEDYALLEVEIHDLQTGSNWTDTIRDTEYQIRRQWMRTEALLAEAGFVLGWRPHGVNRGSIDHLVLVKEAVDRCWLQRAADLIPDWA